MDRKNTNYFTGTNFSSNENEFKGAKKSFKSNTLRKKDLREDKMETKSGKAKNTKITSKIEGGSKFDKEPLKKEDSMAKIKDFNIKNILFSHIKKKQEELQQKNHEFSSEAEGDDETEEKKQDRKDTEIREEDLEEVEANKIKVLKKGMKIKIKRETKINQQRDTPLDDVLVNRVYTEESGQEVRRRDETPPKTTIPGHGLTRELILNDILLEGKNDEDNEETKPAEEIKPEETKNFDEKHNDDTVSEHANAYLEKFKYPYRSNIIATGTISLVVTLKNTEELINIPNP